MRTLIIVSHVAEAGGMIGFLMDFEGMSFDDAVEKAANLASIDIGKMCQSKTISFLKNGKQFYILRNQKSLNMRFFKRKHLLNFKRKSN